jgi:hypothetical protein
VYKYNQTYVAARPRSSWCLFNCDPVVPAYNPVYVAAPVYNVLYGVRGTAGPGVAYGATYYYSE